MLRLPLLLSACLVLAGCATGYGSGYGNDPNGPYYPGGYGDQYGGQYGSKYGSQRFIATVEGVDARYGRVVLGVGALFLQRLLRLLLFLLLLVHALAHGDIPRC